MENKSSRRKFMRNIAIMGGATSMAGSIISGSSFSASASTPENTDLQDLLLMSNDNATHLSYFDPAEEAVTNPGMGVTGYVVSDHMHTGGNSREEWKLTEGNVPMKLDRNTFDRFIQLPHIDNLYFRADWRTFQKEKGKLTLPEEWYWMMEAVEKYNKPWSFRIMNCSPHSPHGNSLPDFLQGKFKMIPYWQNGLPSPYPKYFPEYSDEYLKWWGELVELSGKQFDNHPLLEYTDISGYGFWGEMHHWAQYSPDGKRENYFPGSQEVLDKCLDSIIKSYLNAFPLTPTALCLAARFYKPGVEAYKKGLVWPRRDSFQTSYSMTELMLSQGLTKGVGMIWEIIVPGAHIQTDEQKRTEYRTTALPQRYYDIGSHYAAMGFNPWDAIYAHENCLLTCQDIQRQIGYKIRPSIIWKRKNDKQNEELILGLCNDGCVGVPGQLTINCKFSNKQVVSLDLPLGEPESRNIKPFILPIPETIATQNTSDGCELSLSLKMKGKVFPVKWAVSKKQVKDPYVIQVNRIS